MTTPGSRLTGWIRRHERRIAIAILLVGVALLVAGVVGDPRPDDRASVGAVSSVEDVRPDDSIGTTTVVGRGGRTTTSVPPLASVTAAPDRR